jgi:hypothetical protein
MKINLSWALGFKLFVILFGVGLIGTVLWPSREEGTPSVEREQHPIPPDHSPPAPAGSPVTEVLAASAPMTRAVLDGIYFDVVRATGQGEQLEIELRAYNTGPDRIIVPGRAKGILEPALFATVFDEQAGKWYADQVRIANVTSTVGFLAPSRLISGVPTAVVLTFAQMPVIAGTLQIRTIPRLEVPVVVGDDEPQPTAGQRPTTVLVFRQISVEGR